MANYITFGRKSNPVFSQFCLADFGVCGRLDSMKADISPLIVEKAPLILAEIEKAKSILLHCHPSPDPDSVGSSLAMKFALEQLGKKVTLIKGDSVMPVGFSHFPGFDQIVPKNFFEVDLSQFDLFIILDSGSKEMVSRIQPIEFPLPIRTIVIDHHASNRGYGDVNLVEPDYPAAAQILFDLFGIWKVKTDPDIAANLFIGIYTDTGGFKYPGTTTRTFIVAGELIRFVPDFPKLIATMENSATVSEIKFQALALNSLEVCLDGQAGFSVIPNELLVKNNVSIFDVRADQISPILRTVAAWKISGILVEVFPGKVKMSFRSSDGDIYDVSKLAVALGGGGHKAASGAVLDLPIKEAFERVVAKAEELYNL